MEDQGLDNYSNLRESDDCLQLHPQITVAEENFTRWQCMAVAVYSRSLFTFSINFFFSIIAPYILEELVSSWVSEPLTLYA